MAGAIPGSGAVKKAVGGGQRAAVDKAKDLLTAAIGALEGGTIAEARIGLTNMGSTPLRARSVEEALVGRSASDLGDACASAADGTNPPSDLNGDADYRRHLAGVLTRRAVSTALGG